MPLPSPADLHRAIMNLPCEVPDAVDMSFEFVTRAYKMGHRDARHAAAELTLAAVPVAQLVEAGMQKSDTVYLTSDSVGNVLLSAPPRWEPIDTAPKNRVHVLVWWDGRILGEARYIPEEDTDDFGWWWANTDPGDYFVEKISPDPTHWMPLPPPPTEPVVGPSTQSDPK